MIENVFPRMGTTVRVLLPNEDASMIDFVTNRLLHLEELWSRFIPTSDISLMAKGDGRLVQIAPETVNLVQHLVSANTETNGLFDPTIMPALIEAGYKKSRVDDRESITTVADTGGQLSEIKLDAVSNTVSMPKGMSLDAGGLGKGLAADIVGNELIEMGVVGASISVGGDVALVGTPDDGENWVVNIGAPHDYSATISTVRLRGGGVATSTLAAKTWEINGEHRHHVIDPKTRKPVVATSTSTLQASVIAGTAAWAEAFATALTVAPLQEATELVEQHKLSALLILHNGDQVTLGDWARYH